MVCAMQSGIDLRWLMYNWVTIVGFHRWPAVCSHGIQCKKEVKKLTLYKILKNIWDEVILCFFRNCFLISENITFIDVTLNKILATKYMQAYLHIVFYFHTISIFFHSVCAQIKHEIFSQKNTDCFPWSLDMEAKKCYWWNLKS